jgi:DNA polymerase-3 subunit alpha
LKIHLETKAPEFAEILLSKIHPHLGGECPVVIAYNGSEARGEILLGQNYQVHPHDSLLLELRELLGQDRVRLEFSARTTQYT